MTAVQNSIPLVDLKAQWNYLAPEVNQEIQTVLSKTDFILGQAARDFEANFARFLGVRHAIGVASGTDALHLALRACGIGPGDEVITTNFTFAATVMAILMAGATPVVVDIDPATYTISPDDVERQITGRTKAFLPVHLYGYPCAMDRLLDLARSHSLYVIEDACQAHGALYRNKRVGGIGHVGCFSFYPSKNLGAFGDGGAVVTNQDDLAEKLRLLRDYGRQGRYDHVAFGLNSRLDTLQAAVLNVKLKYLDHWNSLRRTRAGLYRQLLKDMEEKNYLTLPPEDQDEITRQVYHLFVIRTPYRDPLLTYLQEQGVSALIHYPKTMSQLQAFRSVLPANVSYPVSESCAREVMSLPLYPELSEEQIHRVVQTLHRFFEEEIPRHRVSVPSPGLSSTTPPSKKILPSLSVVIPAYNEEETVEEIALKTVAVARDIAREFEVILVNDGSEDRTGVLAEALAKKNPFLRVYHHPFNIGYGGAQKTGILISKYDYLTFVPCDAQFNVEELQGMARAFYDDPSPETSPAADIVVGYRQQRHDSLFRKMKTFFFRQTMRTLFGVKLRDVNWVKIFNKGIFNDINVEFRGIGVDAEIIVKAKLHGARFREVPVHYYPRRAGQAKGDKIFNVLVTVFELIYLWFRYVFPLTRRNEEKLDWQKQEST